MPRQKVYEDDEVELFHYSTGRLKKKVLVTFNAHIPRKRREMIPQKPLKGGWEDQIVPAGYDALFFVAKQNHWFNLTNLSQVILAARGVLDKYRIVNLLGASLGGHAAIRLSSRLSATSVIAISPQFCIRPKLVGDYETRWQGEAKDIDKYDLPISESVVKGKVYVLYDGLHAVDAAHARKISSEIKCELVDLPDSGHSSARALHELGLLSTLFRMRGNMLRNCLIIKHVAHVYSEKRFHSPKVMETYLERLGDHACKKEFLLKLLNDSGDEKAKAVAADSLAALSG